MQGFTAHEGQLPKLNRDAVHVVMLTSESDSGATCVFKGALPLE
jgi:hypothetical protein